ncbi:MAG: phospholipase D-like domain-containing protein [Nitrospirota bacterium]
MKNTERFISNDELWMEMQTHVSNGKQVCAAFAYMGTEGASLLRLKKGDKLVVDMSPNTVKQGGTNPNEIKKLRKRGVHVFTRNSLHAKFLITDNILIAGSANISNNSNKSLDEAGIITKDPAAIRRAKEFFEKLCTEPVRDNYLAECIKIYRPPVFSSLAGTKSGSKKGRVMSAKLWFIGGLILSEVHPNDKTIVENLLSKTEHKLKNPDKTSVSRILYHRKPKFMDNIMVGDWVIECIKDSGRRYIKAPSQVLGHDSYLSYTGTMRHLLMLESPNSGEEISLSKFRRQIKNYEPMLDKESPRTRPIINNEHADAILRFWTTNGKVRSKR